MLALLLTFGLLLAHSMTLTFGAMVSGRVGLRSTPSMASEDTDLGVAPPESLEDMVTDRFDCECSTRDHTKIRKYFTFY